MASSDVSNMRAPKNPIYNLTVEAAVSDVSPGDTIKGTIKFDVAGEDLENAKTVAVYLEKLEYSVDGPNHHSEHSTPQALATHHFSLFHHHHRHGGTPLHVGAGLSDHSSDATAFAVLFNRADGDAWTPAGTTHPVVVDGTIHKGHYSAPFELQVPTANIQFTGAKPMADGNSDLVMYRLRARIESNKVAQLSSQTRTEQEAHGVVHIIPPASK
ncbi:hypothetical protein HK405_003346 [Cladochytrium tenue]|nr:hypothetical protein HK405_003346 [Cladochytrium tenue]